jgi:hypothetical protein
MQCGIRISPLRHRVGAAGTAKETLDEIASPETTTTKRKRKQPTESKRDSR